MGSSKKTESSVSRTLQAQIKLCVMIDTGATVNILDGSTYNKFNKDLACHLAL